MPHANKHYDTLGVRQNSPAKELDHAHLAWVQKLHPWDGDDADERWARQQVLDRVNAAYAAVTHERRNRAH